ncbi:MAG: hypothetical protein CSA44_01650 [Gammaproteobacteria bacterium]|nr:MAG: hypothetical protein CSA44_01650 [Gammaproteobacteria bacterium]
MAQFINHALLPVSLAIIMLSIGLSVRWADFKALKQQKTAIVSGFILQVIALPLLAFLLLHVFAVQGEYAVAIMIVACCPGGVTSNAITFIFSGVVALSVVLTLLSSIVAPLTIPFITDWSLGYFIGEQTRHEFALIPTVGKLLLLSIVPIIIGNIIRHFYAGWCSKNSRYLRRFSGILFLFVITLMAVINFHLLANVISHIGLFIVLMSSCSIVLGFFTGVLLRLPSPVCLTLSIEVGIQNAGMGLIITGAVLNHPAMSMVLITYGIVMQIPLFAFAACYRYRQALLLD